MSYFHIKPLCPRPSHMGCMVMVRLALPLIYAYDGTDMACSYPILKILVNTISMTTQHCSVGNVAHQTSQ